MEAQVQQAVIARVDVGRVDVGQVSLGDIVVGRLRVDDARVAIRSGRALLRDVVVTMRLEISVDWFVDVGLFRESGTEDLDVVTIPFALGDFEIPGLRDIDLDIATLTGTDVQTRADPLANLRLTGLAAEDVRASGVVLPTAGFTLAGLDLTSLTVADVDVPAAGVAAATVRRVGGTPLTLPTLRLRGLELPSAAAGDIRSGTVDIPLQRRERISLGGFSLGFVGVSVFARPAVATRVAQLQLTGVRASLAAGLVELGNVTVPFTVHGLTLADLGVHSIDIPTITVAQP
ncbi:hypothetical protein [Geodermatophilus sp. SYSU D01105]